MKKAVVIAVLLWAGIWPLIHRGLVARYDLNPWKFSGWAMYATPKPPVVVAAFRSTGAGLAVIDERTLPEESQRALDRFRVRRHALGKLEEPEDAARAILASRPELPSVLIMVQTFHLDSGSALMKPTLDRYRYDRQ